MATNTILLTARKGKEKRFNRLHPTAVSSKAQIQASLSRAGRETLWISADQDMMIEFLKSVSWPTKRLGRAMLLFKPPVETLTALRECFERIAFGPNSGFLPGDDLAEALRAKNRDDLFIGGSVDKASETVTLWRGNLDSLIVPFSAFPASGDGTAPSFSDFSVSDCGNTIRFGNYEAAADSILYEFDPEYRRRKSKERLESERTLGASIRRLRKQRGLKREDFEPLASKTLARIEQGKVKSVHAKTLATIAKVLGVQPEEIEEY
ncbi:MAG: helix-turn-helix transcriptional regulator [Pirellulales bacterium]